MSPGHWPPVDRGVRPRPEHVPGPKIRRPETLAQAQRFDNIRAHYERAGLCAACAAQAAYGHAYGFTSVHARCPGCPGGTQVWECLPKRLQTVRSLRWLNASGAIDDGGGSV
jgi:hypothetical protein